MTFSLSRFARGCLSILAVGSVLFSASPQAATGTIMPTPFQTVLDTAGNPVSGAKICTFAAGTTTPTATYTDSALSVANLNPIVADGAGRFTAYLSPGASYKFQYQDATGTAGTCNGVTIKTVDNISATPASSANLDVTGTAGEALTAGQAVYLSDGSASKTAGQWYKADSANGYSSVVPQIGMVPASITSGSSGTIRLGGQMTGLTVSLGLTYYVGTTGAITTAAPVQARRLGVADSVSTLILSPNPPVPTQPWVDDFRLTLTTATPVTTADVTAATTIYASPYLGNRLDLPDTNGNPVRVTSAEFSIAVPGASNSQLFDVYAFNNSGVAALELLTWTNDTTRATAVVRTTNGRYFKSGDNTRLYLGTFRTTTVNGQTEDSAAKRYLWNYYNRIEKPVQKSDGTASWTYTTATWRQARADATNQADVVQGIAESPLKLDLRVTASSSSGGGGGISINLGIGEDSTTAPVNTAIAYINIFTASTIDSNTATLIKVPAAGRHTYVWLEASLATGTTTWYGTNNGVGGVTTVSGLFGTWWC